MVYTYANQLAKRGHRVHVVHPRRLPPGGWPPPAGLVGRARRIAARMRDLIMRPALSWVDIDPRVQLDYVPQLTARHVPDADAVIATWWSTAEAAMTLPVSKGVRLHLIQGYEVWNGAEARVHDAWRAPLHKIFISRWLLELALELGVPPDAITLIPNAIDQDTFRIERPIAGRAPRVAMLYSDQVYKGGEPGLEALHLARGEVPDLTAVLFGVSSPPRQLPSWVTYIRNATPRQLAGHVYSQAAVYLCPSLSEGWHLPPAEAMACGCALASSDIGGVRDYATDGETALLYPAGDAAEAARCVIELIRNEELRVRLATAGAERIAGFSWDSSGAQLEALLVRVTRGRGL